MKHIFYFLSLTLLCSFSTVAQPANDDCSGAYTILCGQAIADSTTGATVDSLISCGTSNGAGGGVWYTFTGVNSADPGAANGTLGDEVTLFTCNQADFDTKIRVYTGCGDSLVCVDGNDDGPGCSGFSSLLSFDALVGEDYFVLVHGFDTQEGNFILTLDCVAQPDCGDGTCASNENFTTCPEDCPVPAGATCESAITIGAGASVLGAQILQGTSSQDDVCNVGTDDARWYVFSAPEDGLLTVEATAGGDTYLSILTGPCLDLTCVDEDDDGGAGNLSKLTDILVQGGQDYYIEWDDTYASGANPFDFNIQFSALPPCPDPSNISVVTDSVSAVLTWTDNAGANNYQVEYGLSGFIQGSGIFFSTFGTTTTIEGLEYETSYDYYLRAFCGGGDGSSTWIQGSFTTLTGPFCDGGSLAVYLPENVDEGPAVIVCDGDTVPDGYILAEYQTCAEQIVYSDPSCLEVSWDVICQAAYNSCIGTCDDGVQNGEETGIDCGGPDCPECVICEENELKLSIVTDGWGAETTWVLFDSEGAQVESGGPYVNEFNDGEYPQPDVFICVPDGCYDFTIYDSAGDGQCCAYGFGSYSLTLDGEVLASGGEFDDSETTNFCLGDTGPDCSVFDTPPTDLTKSFDPVNGIQDRVQVKWFKASPQVKYSDADAAACDIKFWPKRNLDPVTGNVTGDPIVAAPGDTINILDTKKFQQDGVTPREIFKWPVKFRKNSDNPNAKRADANIRYQWQVRCACLHGEGPESPWSDIKIFNTPDFDPETGIFTPPGDVLVANDQAKLHGASVSLNAFPNPNNGEGLNLDISDLTLETSMVDVQIIDITGKQIQAQRYSLVKSNDYLEIRFDDRLKTGMYFIILQEEGKIHHTRFMVKN